MAVSLPGAAAAGGPSDELAVILSRLATTRTDVSAGSDLLLFEEADGTLTQVALSEDGTATSEQPWTPPADEEA